MQPPPANPIFHRHLVLGYSFAWIAQLSYLAYVIKANIQARKQPKL